VQESNYHSQFTAHFQEQGKAETNQNYFGNASKHDFTGELFLIYIHTYTKY
jgi:hypothetical protein